jgi:hypothetical protein
MFAEIGSEWNRLTEESSKFHDRSIFLPEQLIREKVLPAIAITTVALTLVYLLLLQFGSKILPRSDDTMKKRKLCYQATNVFFNVCIGYLGVYCEYILIPSLPIFHAPSIDRVVGLEDELYWLSALQLGYQMWAIPVGIFHAQEDIMMILHHVSVVISASTTGFFSLGFRYYTPFFFGVMELSSLPLSLMNVFKDNPSLRKKYPTANVLSRFIFAISFLVIRVYLCLWKWPVYLRDSFLVFWTREISLYKAYLFVQFAMASFLTFLQLYWGLLIAKGLISVVMKPKKDKMVKAKRN